MDTCTSTQITTITFFPVILYLLNSSTNQQNINLSRNCAIIFIFAFCVWLLYNFTMDCSLG